MQLADPRRFARISEIAGSGAFSHVLLLGMGGSSLGPDVIRQTFGTIAGFPTLHVLDSTDPAQVMAVEARVDLARTLCIVSSKSGSTLEPNIFEQYFFARVAAMVGPDEAGRRFVAITDPHSKMQHVAEGEGFRRVFFGWPDIGGRYSVLSDFGLVPAAAMGVDVAELLDRTEVMVSACLPTAPADENPAVVLGTILGLAATQFGRDKVTFLASPRIASIGSWLEQLLAESTGKEGRGLIPIDREAPAPVDAYGGDRLFVYLRLASEPDRAQDELADALARAGHPVVRIALDSPYDLGQEFFRWEMATAVAGSILGIHPFDQPDVEASKTATQRLTAAYEASGALPAESPVLRRATGSASTPIRRTPRRCSGPSGGRRRWPAFLRRSPRPAPAGRLLRPARLPGDERRERARAAGDPRPRPRQPARRDLSRIRAALLALDRSGLQGRAEHGRLPAAHLRRRRRSAGPREALHLRHRQGGPGAR